MPLPLDVLLVIRASAEHYPSTVNQANLLAGCGLRVGMIHLSSRAPSESALKGSVRQWHPHLVWNSKTEPRASFPTKLKNWLSFGRSCHQVIRGTRPKVVIGYEPLACARLEPAPRSHRTVYHFHELPETYPGMGIGSRFSFRKVKQQASKAALVVFSDEMRAKYYQEEAQLPACPAVVMNCPVRLETVPISPMRSLLAQRGFADQRVVCYLGSVGVNQGLSQVAQSMKDWPPDSVFVLVGPYSHGVHDEIMAQANAAKAASRVLFLGPQPHNEALALTAGADLGVSLIQPNSRNLEFSSGAVNKRFEYMALGLPQVTNIGPGVAEIVEHNQCGLCADPNSPEAIGAAVKLLLGKQTLLKEMGRHGRKLHLENYNYETQFSPVMAWIKGQCASSD